MPIYLVPDRAKYQKRAAGVPRLLHQFCGSRKVCALFREGQFLATRIEDPQEDRLELALL